MNQRFTLEKRARDIPVAKNAQFLGTRSDVPVIHDASDPFVLAAQFALVDILCIGALAMELPVIGSDDGGVKNAVGEEVGGFYYAVPDHEALAVRMVRVAADPTLRQDTGRNGRETVEHLLSATGSIERLNDKCAELVKRKRAS